MYFFLIDFLFVIIIALDSKKIIFEEQLLLIIGRDNWPPDLNYMYGVFYFCFIFYI